MISIARAQDSLIDWDGWLTPLNQFAQASGLTVSAFDTAGQRQVGPLTTSRTADLLKHSTLWLDNGPGTQLERQLVAHHVLDDSAAADADADALYHGMRVCSIPLRQQGQVYGVITYGWRFEGFTSPMECERIARVVGVQGAPLWNEVRLESPVSKARMATYRALLATLVDSIDRQRDTINELNRLARARDLFLATVSHEMRTPLSALSLRLEVMLRGGQALPAPIENGLNAMRKHVQQEATMIDDLIDAARTLTGQMSVRPTPHFLGPILRDAVDTIDINAQQKGVTLSVLPDYGDTLPLMADAPRLQQVLWNLLLNAIKFTPRGGRIDVRVQREAGHVAISVSDSGQGIAAADLPHVFGAFNLQTDANATGLGLGLYIARRIVELHDGELTATSAGRGEGATFTLRLPLQHSLAIA